MSQSLTLFEIEKALVELMEAREHPDMDEAGRQAIDAQVREWMGAELTKVDACRGFLRNAENMIAGHKEEAARQLSLAASWESQRDYLKGCVQGAMEAAGKTKVEGRTGYFALKTAGGKQAVVAPNGGPVDPNMIPDEFCVLEGSISAVVWRALCEANHVSLVGGAQLRRVPRLSLIEAELQKPCEKCKGVGAPWNNSSSVLCESCGGSGKRGVPGCRLAPRGVRLEVK